MCTVTYVPLKGYDFVLTSNRDEAPTRAEVDFPSFKNNIVFPKDGKAGGTWIATSGDLTACLLNGAFVKHDHKPPYRISRGLVVLAAFEYSSAEEFVEGFDFKGIEPFTLILAYKKEDVELFEIRWDGKQLYLKEHASHKPYIWASCTLYSKEVIEERQQKFDGLIENFEYTQKELLDFHSFKSDDSENGIVMDRGVVQTISITSILSTEQGTSISYHDLISGDEKTAQVNHESSEV